MDCTAMIQSKMLKVEKSLIELNNEILIATNYLLQLKENSAAIVSSLNSITAPAAYLQEFVNVNSFLLKSITFLTEFNCKVEMLDVNEKSVLTLINKEPIVGSKITNESKENLNCKCIKELNPGDNSVLKKNKQPEIISANQNGKGKKKKKKKSKKLSSDQLENQSNNTNIVNGDINSNKKSYIANVSIRNNIDSCAQTSKVKQKSNICMQTEIYGEKSFVSVDAKQNKPEDVAFAEMIVAEANNNQSKKLSESSVVKEIPKVKDCWYDSEDSEDFKHTEYLEHDDRKESIQTVTEEDDIKPVKLVREVGKEYNVVLECIKSPSEFYVSIIDKETNFLAELKKSLKLIPPKKDNLCKNRNQPVKAALSKEIGNFGLVYSKCDEMWCRVKITNWCLNYNDEYVNAFLLDYGESKCVSIYDLQAMPKYLKQYPQYTVQCHLHNVFPLDMENNYNTLLWGRESTELMKSLTEDSAEIRMKIAPDDCFHPVTSLPVTLWLVDQDNKCLNELLVSKKHAIHRSVFENLKEKTEITGSCTDENVDLNNWNPMKEDYESYKNSYDLDINDPAANIYGYVGKDYERICKHFANSGYCFKGDACKKEHKKFDPMGFTTDQEEVYQSAINNLIIPPSESKLNVQVTCLLECNKFFCFMEGCRSTYDDEDLPGLLKFMNKTENVLEMKKLLIPPSTGQIVVARFSEDEAWYRARVLESQPEKDQYTVMFVDYGNKETLPLSDIRAIEGRYLHLPFQAILCSIYGIEQNPKVLVKDVMDFMKRRMGNGHVTIEVISKLPGENISLLVNVYDQKGGNIGLDMITKNYAIRKSEMIVNSTSESMPG